MTDYLQTQRDDETGYHQLNRNGMKDDFASAPLQVEGKMPVTSDGRPAYDEENHWKCLLISYSFATLATLIKTVAWWFNQWPITQGWSYFFKWLSSASIAGCEYLPMTFAFQYASSHFVHLSLMTAYMEAADNFFRMLQQYFLGDPLRLVN